VPCNNTSGSAVRIGLEAGLAHVRSEYNLKSTPDIEVVFLNCNYSHRVIFHEMD